MAATLLLAAAFVLAGRFKRESGDAGRDVVVFALLLLAVLALLLGAFFALVEARKPVQTTSTINPVPGQARELARGAGPMVPIEVVTKVVDAFSGRKASAVLFGIGFTLTVFAAVGSGLVSVSVDTGTGNSPAPAVTPSTTATP